MLKSGLFSDICILVKDSEFPCHRFMLARSSEFFEKLFQKDGLETGRVRLEDTFPQVFQIILNFIYTEKKEVLTGLTSNTLVKILKNANMWLISEVEECCIELLRKKAENMNAQSLIYLYAEFYLLENKNFLKNIIDVSIIIAHRLFFLKIYCYCELFQLLQKQSVSDVTALKVSNLRFDCFKDFVQSTSHIFSEINRFAMVECWILKNVDFQYSCIDDYKCIISTIDFMKMTIQQFRDGPGKSILLSDKDKYEKVSEIAIKNQNNIFDARNRKLICATADYFMNHRFHIPCIIVAKEDFDILYRRGNMEITDQSVLELCKNLPMHHNHCISGFGEIFVESSLHTFILAKGGNRRNLINTFSNYLRDLEF